MKRREFIEQFQDVFVTDIEAVPPKVNNPRMCGKIFGILCSSFDIGRNWKRLTHRPSNNLHNLDGFRALAILWLISFHTMYFYKFCRDKTNVCPVGANDDLMARPSLRLLFDGHFGVDVFFVLSGFLIAHFLMQELKVTGKIDYFKYFLRRFLRIVPLYYTWLTIFYSIIKSGLVSYPQFPYAWRSYLFIMNLFPYDEQFMEWTWSLSVEVQFYVTFPLILALLYRLRSSWRFPFLIMLVLSSFIVRAIVLANAGIAIPEGGLEVYNWYPWWNTVYVKPWMKYGGLYIGVTLAYVYHHTHWVSKAHKKPWIIALLFIIAVLLLLFALMPYPFHVGEKGFSFAAFFFIFWRPLVSLAVSILMFCSFGDSTLGTVVGWIFKWDIWYPVAQLSYCMFIIHPMLMAVLYNPNILPFQYTPFVLYSYTLFYIAVSMIIATLFYLFVEAPFCNLRIGRLENVPRKSKLKKEEATTGYVALEMESVETPERVVTSS
jgi:peptidoglycan/LPS O-acetylase OafA/YrhL